jgi:hypothetical protein
LLFYEIGGLFEIEFVEFFCHEGFERFEAFVDILKDEFEEDGEGVGVLEFFD